VAVHLPAHQRDAPPRLAVSLVRVTTVAAMTVAVTSAARRGSIVTSDPLAPSVTTTLADPAPDAQNATLAPPVAPARSAALRSLAIVGRSATVTTAVSAQPVVTATTGPRTIAHLPTVPSRTANPAIIADVTAPSVRSALATTDHVQNAHVMTAVPRLAPTAMTDVPRPEPIVTTVGVTSAAPHVSTATIDREQTGRAPTDSAMTVTRAPVAAMTATSARADLRPPRMSF
jgi:hypothetical protein